MARFTRSPHPELRGPVLPWIGAVLLTAALCGCTSQASTRSVSPEAGRDGHAAAGGAGFVDARPDLGSGGAPGAMPDGGAPVPGGASGLGGSCTGTEQACSSLTAEECRDGRWQVRRQCPSAVHREVQPTCETGRCGFAYVMRAHHCAEAWFDREAGSGCSWQLSTFPVQTELDGENGRLQLESSNGSVEVFHVAGEAECLGERGWYFDVPSMPTLLALCPRTCDDFRSPTRLHVQLECPYQEF